MSQVFNRFQNIAGTRLPRFTPQEFTYPLGPAAILPAEWLITAFIERGLAAIERRPTPNIKVQFRNFSEKFAIDPSELIHDLPPSRPGTYRVGSKRITLPKGVELYDAFKKLRTPFDQIIKHCDIRTVLRQWMEDEETSGEAVRFAREVAVLLMLDVEIGNLFRPAVVGESFQKRIAQLPRGANLSRVDPQIERLVRQSPDLSALRRQSYEAVRTRAGMVVEAVGPERFFGKVSEQIAINAVGLEFFPPYFFSDGEPSQSTSETATKERVHTTSPPDLVCESEPKAEPSIGLGPPLQLESLDPNGPWVPILRLYERLGSTAAFCTTGALWERVYAAFLVPAASGTLVASFDSGTPSNAVYLFKADEYLETVTTGGKAQVRLGVGKNAFLMRMFHTSTLETRLRQFLETH